MQKCGTAACLGSEICNESPVFHAEVLWDLIESDPSQEHSMD